MAEEDFGDRTEPATPRRREEARRQGQVAFSHELVSSVLLLAAAAGLLAGGAAIGGGLLQAVRGGLGSACPADPGPAEMQSLFAALFRQAGEMIGPLLTVAFLTALAVGLLQTGFLLNGELLGVRWERLAPNWGRVFSGAALMRGLVAVLKVALVGVLAWWALRGRLHEIAGLCDGTLARAVVVGWGLAVRLLLALAGGMALVGVIDYLWQRWRLERSLRLTREEVKEEARREEGDPKVRARIRKLQREAAQARMMQEVAKATVVITNPVKLAIALRYDPGAMPAPRVVAKGSGPVAKRIVELARQQNVPVVERRPLARALYRAVQVRQEIPAELYLAVAELLAYVYRLRPGSAPRAA